MSYQSWHDYGYGICIDDVNTTVDKVLNLIHLAPEFEKKFYKWAKDFTGYDSIENIVNEITMDDINEYYNDNFCVDGLAPIVSSVIKECEDIELLACSDYNGFDYLIFSVTYPWSMTDKEKNMTENDVRLLIAKYVNLLTNNPVTIDYQSVENGG